MTLWARLKYLVCEYLFFGLLLAALITVSAVSCKQAGSALPTNDKGERFLYYGYYYSSHVNEAYITVGVFKDRKTGQCYLTVGNGGVTPASPETCE